MISLRYRDSRDKKRYTVYERNVGKVVAVNEIAVYTVTKNKMREYKITKWDLGYLVYRTKTENDLQTVEWLQKDTYTLNKNFARTFYHLDDAISNLIIARRKWDDIKETSEEISESIPERHIEKQLWSELW